MVTHESSLTVLTRLGPDGPTVFVRGEVDLASAPQLREAALRALSPGPKALCIDLAGVTFMDVCGLQVLLSAQRSASRAGGRLVLARTPPVVDRLLDLTGTRAVLHGIDASRDAAPATG